MKILGMEKTHVGNKSKHRAKHASPHYLHRKACNIVYLFYLFTCLLIYKRIGARESFIFSKTSTRALGTIQPSNSIGTGLFPRR